MDSTLRETNYADGVGHEKKGVVRYLLQGSRCVFSGITGSAEFMSTVNAAEYVIDAIAEAEGIDPIRTEFFDLHTNRAYTMARGQYDFMRLTVERQGLQIHVTQWSRCQCPPEILRYFDVSTH